MKAALIWVLWVVKKRTMLGRRGNTGKSIFLKIVYHLKRSLCVELKMVNEASWQSHLWQNGLIFGTVMFPKSNLHPPLNILAIKQQFPPLSKVTFLPLGRISSLWWTAANSARGRLRKILTVFIWVSFLTLFLRCCVRGESVFVWKVRHWCPLKTRTSKNNRVERKREFLFFSSFCCLIPHQWYLWKPRICCVRGGIQPGRQRDSALNKLTNGRHVSL